MASIWPFKIRRPFDLKNSSFFSESGCLARAKIHLKVGAMVTLLANLDVERGLSNGALGKVLQIARQGDIGQVLVDFHEAGQHWIKPYEFRALMVGVGETIRKQVPLRLAWAVTHHRSQGQTYPRVRVNPTSFADGQAYVALSRATHVAGLELLRPLKTGDVRVNPAVRSFVRHMRAGDLVKAYAEAGTWKDIPLAAPNLQNEVATKLGFGRHRELTFEECRNRFPDYCEWCNSLNDPSPQMIRFVRWLKNSSA